MPILTFEALDDVPEGLRDFAKDHGDGKITVNVVPEAKLSEFRDNNINVSKERDTLLEQVSKLKGIVGEDPEAFEKDLAELRVTRDRVAAGDLRESRALEEALSKRTEEMRKKFEEELQTKGRELNAWRDKHSQLDRRYRDGQVIQAIKDAATTPESGVEPRAISDVAKRALEVFRVMDDGRMIPLNGDVPIYGTNGVDPMTPGEWLQKLKEEAPYYFKGTQGGGAGGDNSKKGNHGMTFNDLKSLTAAEKLALANKENRPYGK
jgi:hypothetical protein